MQLLGSFYAFGDRIYPYVSQLNDRASDLRILFSGYATDSTNEGAVNFQYINWKAI